LKPICHPIQNIAGYVHSKVNNRRKEKERYQLRRSKKLEERKTKKKVGFFS